MAARGERVATTALIATLLAGCFGGTPDRGQGLPGERRAALARLVVDNRTARSLDIGFRYALEPEQEVVVGRIAPGDVAEMAPVPAEEPIIFVARGTGFELRLEPRSLDIDAIWTWVIPADSVPDGA